jgi:hypothetical protein
MNGQESFWAVRVTTGWAVKRQGSRELIAVYERQQEAWAEARRLAGGKAGFNAPAKRSPVFRGLAA